MDLVFKATLGYKNCGINFVDINEWNSDEEHNREYNSAKKRLIQHSNMFDYDFSFKISKGFPKSCNIIGLITSRKLGSALGLQSLNMLLTFL